MVKYLLEPGLEIWVTGSTACVGFGPKHGSRRSEPAATLSLSHSSLIEIEFLFIARMKWLAVILVFLSYSAKTMASLTT